MGIFLGGTAMGSPACVSHAENAVEGRFLNDLFEIAQLARRATDFELAIGTYNGDAGGVIAAVFELAEAFDDYGDNFLATDVTDDTAHGRFLRGKLGKSLA
jgi:hypothetical protein